MIQTICKHCKYLSCYYHVDQCTYWTPFIYCN